MAWLLDINSRPAITDARPAITDARLQWSPSRQNGQLVEEMLNIDGLPFAFGETIHTSIPHLGELLNYSFVEFTVSALPAGYQWVPYAPLKFIKEMTAEIGGASLLRGEEIYKMTADSLLTQFCMNKFTAFGKPYPDSIFTSLDSTIQNTFIVPICQMTLNLCAIQYHSICFRISMNQLSELVEQDNSNAITANLPNLAIPPTVHLSGRIVNNYVHIDDSSERIDAYRFEGSQVFSAYDTHTGIYDTDSTSQFDINIAGSRSAA